MAANGAKRPDGQISQSSVQPRLKKYSASPLTQISFGTRVEHFRFISTIGPCCSRLTAESWIRIDVEQRVAAANHLASMRSKSRVHHGELRLAPP